MVKAETVAFGVIGAGSWGTTLGNLLAAKGHDVDLWVREEDVYQQIKKDGINRQFLPDVVLEPNLRPVRHYEEAVRGKAVILMVVPSHVYRRVLEGVARYMPEGAGLVTGTKGIENETLKVMSEVTEDVLGQGCLERYACLTGPSFAKEVSQGHPTAVTIASRNVPLAEDLQRFFSTPFFRVYVSSDLIGVQLCGALKNVIAIAAGASDGLRFGHNARAALITRGLAEITRLGVALGANPHTFAGLAGMGDLVLTCTGDLSRNRTVGLKIGKGSSLNEIVEGMDMVAEGVKNTMSAFDLAKKVGVEMPIVNEVYEILYGGKPPMEAVKALMGRELKKELET